MQILFAISILCSAALVWAGVAIARHIHKGRATHTSTSVAPSDFAQHLFRAAAISSDDEGERFHIHRTVPHQTLQEITAKKRWNQPPESVTVHPSPELRADLNLNAAEPLKGKRKSPQASHQGGVERLDWAYFNKDMGDLTDPYQTPRIRANSRTSPKRL
jgi:hypothetical protein